jgi:SAM-dependent methyltransferase
MSAPLAPATLTDWFATSLGAYVVAQERTWVDAVVPDIFGFHAVQLGAAGGDWLTENRIPHRLVIDAAGGGPLAARPTHLPIATQSVDLVIAPHLLEFAPEPHDVLREIDRILRPEGKFILTSFNPWSLWGVKRTLATEEGAAPPWSAQFISLPRIKDWLALLGHDVVAGRLACYAPPFASTRWRQRFAFMEAMGDRWWGVGGGVYMLMSVKRVAGMRLMAPAWANRKNLRSELAGAKQAARHSHLKIVKSGGDGR